MTSSAYRKYLLTVLLVIFAFNNVDRLALGLVLQDIKVDLVLTDTQLGLLTGIAFAVFYAVMGIPIARWADRGNRVTIISLTTALWSVAVALCAAAGNFLHLLLIRIGAAVGEAGCIPPAHSLMADYFTRAERPRAVSIYMLGGPLSAVIGFFLAGWLNEYFGWRMTFVLLGVPGLALAALARFTLREPRRGTAAKEVSSKAVLTSFKLAQKISAPQLGTQSLAQPTLKEVGVALWNNATFRHLIFFNAVVCFFGFGIGQWLPAFFIRSYQLQTGELGTWLAAINGVGGIVGTVWGGELASRYAANNESLQLKAVAVGYCSFGLISTFIYLSSNYYFAFGLLALAIIGTSAALGPLYATMQTLVPDRMRAMAFAIVYLFGNLIGMGLGPLLAGALSDAFRPWAGAESIRYALMALCPGYLWAAWHLWQASRTVSRDLHNVQANTIGVSL
jgi:MFS family permease